MPTNSPSGVGTAAIGSVLFGMGQQDPTNFHTFFTDFDTFLATDWTVTETQAGATQALAAGDGGLLLLTNSAADDDINAIQLAVASFVIDLSKAFFLKCRLKVSDVLQSEVLVGLVDTMAAFNPADGVYLYKADGAVPIRLSIENTGVTTNSSADSSATSAANDTFFNLGISYDPHKRKVMGWVDNTIFGSIIDLTNMPTVALAPAIGLRNGEAVAKTMTVDYLFVAKER